MPISEESGILKTWLQDNFICMKCGNCCTNKDSIHITSEDLEKIAKHFKIPVGKARKKYTEPHPTKPGEMTFKNSDSCKFYDTLNQICKINDIKPSVCRVYPFLSTDNSNMENLIIYPDCPGMKATWDVFMKQWREYKADPEEEQILNYLESHQELKEKVKVLWLSEKGYYTYDEADKKRILFLEQEIGSTLGAMKKAIVSKILANAAQAV